jgi:peptidoglycan glycosyltransferase
MNAKIRHLALGLIVCYVALFVQLNTLHVTRRPALTSDPRNDRQTVRDFNHSRGPIITADGVVVAQSARVTDPDDTFTYQRSYPTNDLFANVTGYHTYSYGNTQLERTQNAVLMGTTADQQIESIGNLLTSTDTSGSVVLTMRADAQLVARKALGDREGSVVVLDPNTGAVLAMYSYPSYDPNLIAVHDAAKAGDVLTFLNAYPGKPLLANAYQERYMPGSSFKVITTAAALSNGVATLDRQFPVEKQWIPPQTTDPIQNYGGSACGGSLVEVFYRSCNIPFAQMATELGPERMVAATKDWGIGETLPIDLPKPVASRFGEVADFSDNLPLLAIGGFGQGNDVMVPLHMAMVAATVANGGRMMSPYVVDRTLYHDGRVIRRTTPSVWKTPITPELALTLNGLMVNVVNLGTGKPMQLANGIQAAAKTGTAQLNATGQAQRSHAWIIAFAPAAAPKYAIAVILKGTNDEISASTGGKVAGPVAKQVFDYLFAADAAAAAAQATTTVPAVPTTGAAQP